MRILAFDTCFAAIDVAVADGDRIAAHVSEAVNSGHGERLLPLIERALAEAGLAFADLGRIAVTVGPGGFTGLRVGVAVARALALSTGKPLVAMSSLELLARTALALPDVAAAKPATIIATADARKGMLFAQSFATTPWTALDAPHLVTAADIPTEIELAHRLSSPFPLDGGRAGDGGGAVVSVSNAQPTLPHKGEGKTSFDAASPSSWSSVVIGAGAPAAATASGGRLRAFAADLLPDARVLALAARSLTPATEARPLYVRAADAKPQVGKSLPRA